MVTALTHCWTAFQCDNRAENDVDLDRFVVALRRIPIKNCRFQDVEGIKINVTAELNAVHLETFVVSENVLNKSTNVFKLAKIYFEYK
jgi:hypothetical protein